IQSCRVDPAWLRVSSGAGLTSVSLPSWSELLLSGRSAPSPDSFHLVVSERRLVAARTEGSRATLSGPRSSVVAAHSLHEGKDIPVKPDLELTRYTRTDSAADRSAP